MNYLAHLFLSGENREIQAGNLFGDEVKGKDYENFPENIKIGLLHHRFIDSYTDTHEVNLAAKKKLYPQIGKYAGVALDIYYDHFLAKYWIEYSKIELSEYTNSAYEALKTHSFLFSYKSQHLLELMKKYDWLTNYAEMSGMEKTFSGMANRLGENSGMRNAYSLLVKEYAMLESVFRDYFPDLITFASNKLVNLQKPPLTNLT